MTRYWRGDAGILRQSWTVWIAVTLNQATHSLGWHIFADAQLELPGCMRDRISALVNQKVQTARVQVTRDAQNAISDTQERHCLRARHARRGSHQHADAAREHARRSHLLASRKRHRLPSSLANRARARRRHWIRPLRALCQARPLSL